MQIDFKLDKDFAAHFKRLCEDYGDNIRMLNGFSKEQLNYTTFIDNFIDKNTVADASIDGSSNVNHKDIVSLENEMSKPHSKLLAFNKIFYELKKKNGLKVAQEWLEREWIGEYYLHDAYSSTFKPYCYAYDLDRLAKEGLFFIKDFNSKPPKHLTTFVDFVGEFVSWNCNRTSGAVGLPSYLVYAYYFWREDVKNGYYVKTPEYYRDQSFQEFIYKLNQPFLRGGIQSAFSNISIFDESYYEAMFGDKTFPDGSLMIDSEYQFMEFQKAFLKVVSKIRSQNMMTFPVLTISLLKKDGKFINEDFAKWACKHNMEWNDSNFFISEDVTSLSNCCRLVSNIKDLGYFNSIGGTALEVGSVKVNTINLARIAYETNSIEEYLYILKERVNLDLLVLDRIRNIMRRNVEKGLLPNYQEGLINMEHQYNTIGIIGIYEALQKFGLVQKDQFGNVSYTPEGMKFAKQILATINETKQEFAEKYKIDYKINVEQVPAERAASILAEKDKIFFPDEEYELPMYGNQWIPLAVKTTLQEKINLSAELDKACNGGSIAHINLDAPLHDFNTAWKLLNVVSDAGVTYFAFNVRINACENNHGFYGDVCPYCHKPAVTSYQRIVGFLTPTRSYSKERKAEVSMRDWMDIEGRGGLGN